jgi:hypothetical protein
MPRADADDPGEYIFPSRCYALAGLQLLLSFDDHLTSPVPLNRVGDVAYVLSFQKGRESPQECRWMVRRRVDRVWRQAENDRLAWLRRGTAARDRLRLAYA